MTNQDNWRRDDPAAGNQQRWEHLSRLLEPIHGRAVATARNLCRSQCDGDDLYQEAVLRAFNKLHSLREEAKFRSWFFAVLISVHRSRYRRSFWKRFLPLDDMTPDTPSLTGADGRVHEEEYLAGRRAARALSRLPAVQREAVVLYQLEGFSMEEVATMQDASVSAVKARVFRGREKLRGIYERMGWVRPAPSDPVTPDRDSSQHRPDEAGSGLLLQTEHKISAGRRS